MGRLRVILPTCSVRTYHHREGERHDVDGDQRAEAGQDGEDQVIPGLGSVRSGLCDCTGLARERGPGGARHYRAGPAARARTAVNVAAWLSVELGRHRGGCGGWVGHVGGHAVT